MRAGWILVGLLGCCTDAASVPSGGARAAPAAVEAAAIDVQPSPTPLATIPAGIHRPMFPGKDEPAEVLVPAFGLEVHAVTNRQYLEFVKAQPAWRRSRVTPLFADTGYLAHWSGDLDPGPGLDDRPVTNVSWFAARAYARWIGRRLPSVAEWERAAAASGTDPDGRGEAGFNQRILEWYARPSPAVPAPVGSGSANLWGVHDLHGLIWEWVEDFNTALISGESRGDTGLERQLFCGSGSIGAADPSDYAAFMRFAFRSSLKARYTVKNLGFRCAMDAAGPRTEER